MAWHEYGKALGIGASREFCMRWDDAGRPTLRSIFGGVRCPITTDIAQDPVMTCDGHCYDRAAIQAWFASGHCTSPVTNIPLPSKAVVPCHTVRLIIEAYLQHRPELTHPTTSVYIDSKAMGIMRQLQVLETLPAVKQDRKLRQGLVDIKKQLRELVATERSTDSYTTSSGTSELHRSGNKASHPTNRSLQEETNTGQHSGTDDDFGDVAIGLVVCCGVAAVAAFCIHLHWRGRQNTTALGPGRSKETLVRNIAYIFDSWKRLDDCFSNMSDYLEHVPELCAPWVHFFVIAFSKALPEAT
eukprot:TRINITY_DN61731_c0_g1_i1.p1 TRINITY_DN61731_c0_g1~~TRINITY_DN61731_c0_g1_i1.p1  ORF type:complete len:321 (-),score=21.14 TRINITY_DN61731_c0_g1_i1:51-950(-)